MTDQRKEQVVELEAREVRQLDQQVATARAYPRSIPEFVSELENMVLKRGADCALACIFSLPRGKDTIDGPSIRFAELAASCWGNCVVSSRVVEERQSTIVAEGMFRDFQRNHTVIDQSERSIVGNSGRYSHSLIVQTGAAARAVARRNAILQAIPRVLWEPVYMAARQLAVGDAKTIDKRRTEGLAYLQKFGVTEEMVLLALGVKTVEEITGEHLVTLAASARAIRDNELSIDEVFPKAPKAGKGGVAGLANALGAADGSDDDGPLFGSGEGENVAQPAAEGGQAPSSAPAPNAKHGKAGK